MAHCNGAFFCRKRAKPSVTEEGASLRLHRSVQHRKEGINSHTRANKAGGSFLVRVPRHTQTHGTPTTELLKKPIGSQQATVHTPTLAHKRVRKH